ncbi:transcriptional regulator with XRE-family HTH domain [Thermocatellispora tengchongensis]|uniref:Transcriptional regulator with XRE-family HTH domain n=1 Tax=Thermocatellispora tengchongensis TaxID=1073253 RepID=A0A840PGD7_9ACTN|nr:XRE family transcriptional regulator [Thermocatellispora tengchongensis]MBB5136901.1 transcriptional regulator with XRE-family HTH domain [Thermocatellispora tengchongensis]
MPKGVSKKGAAEVLGDRLRDLRKERGLTLRQLAALIDVSPGLLSQIENGTTDPSLTTVRKLADAFGTSMADLFTEPDAPAVHVSRPGERHRLGASGGGILYDRLTPGRGDLEVLLGHLDQGEATSAEPWAHASTECALVLSGTVTVEVGGRDYRLATGESITFDSRLPHRYLNRDPEPARFVVAITPPNP